MRLTFYGAAQEVTGSMHLVEVNGQRILLECGMFQGRREETYARNLHFPFEPSSIHAVVLSHAHIDHSGNLPNLVKQRYTGNIWCTAATRNLSAYMLMDSGHIQEMDIEYVNRKRAEDRQPPLEPLYTRADAEASLGQFIGVGLHRPILIADGVTLTFYNAGHILGAAHILLEIDEHSSGKRWRLAFSGDIGRDNSALLNDPERFHEADIVIMESTYGDKLHEDRARARRALRNVINETSRRSGKVIIPAFAVGRTQEIVYALNQLDADGDIPDLPVYVDSPLAVNATDVFRMHPEAWREDVREFLLEDKRKSPFDYAHVEYVREVRRSKQLNAMPGPAVIISASGMAESGRILHHLKNNIEYPQNTIVLVTFMAQDTLGRKLKDGARRVRIFGEEYDVRAQVTSIEGYSAHADQRELLEWVDGLDRERLQTIYLVHGEPTPMSVFSGKLQSAGFRRVVMPERGNTFEI
ncbi:MAG: MBL fold metallo-hydrolase [Caldilineaceae bacterium]|nr:MBL fold metallo-hydrolase [Caldilineaceae bacterium]